MKRVLKLLLKIIGWGLTIVLVSIICLVVYTDDLWKDRVSEEEFGEITSWIENSPQLPEGFKNTMEQVYPSIFTSGFTYSAIRSLFFNDYNRFCPSQGIANYFPTSSFPYEHGVLRMRLSFISFIWELENRVSQEACLSALIEKQDFGGMAKGMNQASEYFFQTSPDELTINQQLELILKLRNPMLFNRRRRPNLVNKEINVLRLKMGLDTTIFEKERLPVSCNECDLQQSDVPYLHKPITAKRRLITHPTIFVFSKLRQSISKWDKGGERDSLPAVLQNKDRQAIYRVIDFHGSLQKAYHKIRGRNVHLFSRDSILKYATFLNGTDTCQINTDYFKDRDAVVLFRPGKKPLLIDDRNKQMFCDHQILLQCYFESE